MNQNEQSQQFREYMRTLNKLMAENMIPPSLQLRARAFYHTANALRQDQEDHEKCLASLSPLLYAEISGHIYRNPVRSCMPLQDANFTVCSEVGARFQLGCWSRGDWVHRRGEVASTVVIVT